MPSPLDTFLMVSRVLTTTQSPSSCITASGVLPCRDLGEIVGKVRLGRRVGRMGNCGGLRRIEED